MDIAGTNKANSIGMLLSSSLMLRHLGCVADELQWF
jgi:isocitrate/isopropylmalate dehydrogenase